MVIVDAVHMSHVLCGNTRKNVPSRGLKLVNRRRLFCKCHLNILHLLRAQNVAGLTRERQGGAGRDGGREPCYGNVITVGNDREVHTDSGRLLVLGGRSDR